PAAPTPHPAIRHRRSARCCTACGSSSARSVSTTASRCGTWTRSRPEPHRRTDAEGGPQEAGPAPGTRLLAALLEVLLEALGQLQARQVRLVLVLAGRQAEGAPERGVALGLLGLLRRLSLLLGPLRRVAALALLALGR